MKTCVLVASLLLGATFGARSQTDPGDDPNQPHPHLNRYTEIRTGLNFLNPADVQWTESSDQISITATGAAATNAQHQVVFLGNLNSAGAVDLTTPEGSHLRSNILGLGYYDTSSGDNVVFAEIQNCSGQILPSGNQALYPQAFTHVNADVLYTTVGVAGLEQFVVVREQLPSPADWGMNPATTMLRVWTEFLDPPAPGIMALESEAGPDQLLDFGIMKMGKGEAFAIGSEDEKVPVTKQCSEWDSVWPHFLRAHGRLDVHVSSEGNEDGLAGVLGLEVHQG